jgi:hypothetical protein
MCIVVSLVSESVLSAPEAQQQAQDLPNCTSFSLPVRATDYSSVQAPDRSAVVSAFNLRYLEFRCMKLRFGLLLIVFSSICHIPTIVVCSVPFSTATAKRSGKCILWPHQAGGGGWLTTLRGLFQLYRSEGPQIRASTVAGWEQWRWRWLVP